MDNLTSGEYRAVVDDVKDLKKDSAALAGRVHKEASESVSGTLGRIEETVSDIWETVSRRGSQSYETVERNVEARPMTAVLTAFIAGAIIGWIIDRNH